MDFKKELTDVNEIKKYLDQSWKKIEFEHKGVSAEILRVETINVFNGYLWLDAPEGSDAYQIIDNYFHGGITYQEENNIGFDTAHSMDIVPSTYRLEDNAPGFGASALWGNTYKTAEYVKDVLIKTIDALNAAGLLEDGHIIDARDITAVTYEHMIGIIEQAQERPETLEVGGRFIAETGRGWLAAKIENPHEYGEFPTYQAAIDFLTGGPTYETR